MYADPTARAPRPEPDVIPAGSSVIVSFEHVGMTPVERLEVTQLLDELAWRHLGVPKSTVGAESHHDGQVGPYGTVSDPATILAWTIPHTVGLAPFEKALSAVKGHGITWLFGSARRVN